MRHLLLLPLTLGAAGPAAPPASPAPAAYTVQLHCTAACSDHDFRIRLTRTANGVGVRYERRVRVRREKLRRDPEVAALAAAFSNQALPLADREAAGRRYSARVEAYYVFRRDSLWLPAAQAPAFAQLLDSVSQADSTQLAGGRRLVLGGIWVGLTVRPAGGPPREAYIREPTPAGHPLTYRLLREALGQYRARRPASRLLPASYTGGY